MTQTSSRFAPKPLFTFVATGEAITWAILITSLILRAIGVDPIVVTIGGSIHGAMFLSYGVIAALVGVNQRWKTFRTIGAVALAIVPFATVPFERSLAKKKLLEGNWRTSKSDDPKDAGWFDSLFRWFIGRPFVLILAMAVVVSIIYVTLLSLGSPTEWGERFAE
jgi:integral membrane protein